MPRKIEISHKTIIFTILFLLFLWLLYYLRGIIILLFFSLIFMSALNPLVNRLHRWHLPRALAIILIYVLIFSVIGVAIAGIIPALIDQTQALLTKLPEDFASFRWLGLSESMIDKQINQLVDKLGVISGGVIKTFVGFFQNLINFIVFLVVSFYLLLQRKNLDNFLIKFLGSDGEEKGTRIVDKIEHRLGGWIRAEFLLMIIIGTLSYIGLRLLGIEFALPLAIFAGLLEIIPSIGPFVSAIPAVLAGLVISPVMALAVAALYFLIQQLENSLIVPQIMAKEVGINPLITILGLIAGFKLGGVVGAILAVPIILMIEIVFEEIAASETFKKL